MKEQDRVEGRIMTSDEVKKVELDLLKYLASFCEEHGLRYFLDCGTLLGTIRHNGFIPWDDDIDVAMPLPDYEKLIELLESRRDKDHVDILYGCKKGLYLPFAKLVDTRTLSCAPGRDRDLMFPLWVDIFPTFALSDNDEEAHAQVAEMYDLTKEARFHMRRNLSWWVPFKSFINLVKSWRRARMRYIIRKAEKRMRRYPWGSTKRLRITSIGTRSQLESITPEDFDHYSYHAFEDGQFRIPDCYDARLRSIFKDYMTPPPPEQRVGHTNTSYWV